MYIATPLIAFVDGKFTLYSYFIESTGFARDAFVA
jgi:hypothetical protein